MSTTLELPPTRRIKSLVPTMFKAVGQTVNGNTLADGEFVALAAVFGNVDSYGERMVKGCFADTLETWRTSGDPIPVIWYHAWTDPFAHIGEVLEAEETDDGLLYRGRVDLDDPFSAKVYKLMKGRRVTQQSFGFDIRDAGEIVEDGKSIYEIRAVDLFEVGPCLVGVNQATQLVDIKSTGDGAPAPSATPIGQANPPAAGAPSVAPDSAPDLAPASKSGPSPASIRLALDILELER